MLRIIAAIAAALIAAWLAWPSSQAVVERPDFATGRNNTVLFLSGSDRGVVNVNLGACLGLIENYPETEIHFASLPKIATDVSRISEHTGQNVKFHEIKGLSITEALAKSISGSDNVSLADVWVTAPGLRGLEDLAKVFRGVGFPWNVDEHWELYKAARKVIEDVDPSLVVVEATMLPFFHAVRAMNRKRVLVTAHVLPIQVSQIDPTLTPPWRYPFVASGFPYPVPWRLVPANIYIMIRLSIAWILNPRVKAIQADLQQKGIADPSNPAMNSDNRIILSAFPENSLPLSSIPASLTPCGPMPFSIRTASTENDPDQILNWVQKVPTILVNLGSLTIYDAARIREMVAAIEAVLRQTDAQILWKVRSAQIQPHTELLEVVAPHVATERLKIVDWLEVDPAVLLSTGHISVIVHHGGGNSYEEAVLAGVPHVILPQWTDCYLIATTAEYLNIGIWPGKESAPHIDPPELSQAIVKVMNDKEMKKRALNLAQHARSYGGRRCAADKIAALAYNV